MKELDQILVADNSLKASTACFSGHRPNRLPEYGSLKFGMMLEMLRAKIHEVSDAHKINRYITGMPKGFDVLAAEMVLSIRDSGIRCCGIELECAVPFRGHKNKLRGCADKITCLSESYHSGVYHVRNRYMIDNSSVLICYWDGTETGGTAWTVNYAGEQCLVVYNTYDAVQKWHMQTE